MMARQWLKSLMEMPAVSKSAATLLLPSPTDPELMGTGIKSNRSGTDPRKTEQPELKTT